MVVQRKDIQHEEGASPPLQQQDGEEVETPPGQFLVQDQQKQQLMNDMPLFNASPAEMMCIYCKANITTIAQPEMDLLAWLFVGLLVVTCLWPCAYAYLKSVTHQCTISKM